MERSTLLNLKRKSEQDKKSNNDITNSHDFFKKPGDDEEFENELKKDLFKKLEHVKTDDTYVEPIVQDAETIEKETKNKDDEFFKLALKFSEIDSAAIEQERQENIIDLFDYLEDDKSQVIDDGPKTEDIFIDDGYLFDSLDEQGIKDISNDVTNDIDIDQNEVLFEELPKPEFAVKDKSIEQLSKKIKPNKNLDRSAKK